MLHGHRIRRPQTITLRDAINVSLQVTDAQTGLPISSFKVVYGHGDKLSSPDLWEETRSAKGNDGHYSASILQSFKFHFFRVQAPGYAPEIQKFAQETAPAGTTPQQLAFKLSKSSAITLLIQDPNALPLPKAAVYIIPSSQSFTLQQSALLYDPRYGSGGGQMLQQTDSAGKLMVADPQDPATRLVVIDKSGFAERSFADAVKSPVQLSPWARVDGIAYIGPRPASNKQIAIQYSSEYQPPPYIFGSFTARTDAAGHFSFDHIPPGKVFIGLWIETNLGSAFQQGTMAKADQITLASGQNANIIIGGKGRAVVGRIVGPDGAPVPHAVYSLGSLRQNHPPTYYSFIVSPDGSFEADDVDPGNYQAAINISSAQTNKLLGVATSKFSIPNPTTKPSDSPIDLGNIQMKPTP